MPLRQSGLIEVRRIRGKGRGVFAREAIAAETVIERVPMLIFSATVLEAELWGRLDDVSLATSGSRWDMGRFTTIHSVRTLTTLTTGHRLSPMSP